MARTLFAHTLKLDAHMRGGVTRASDSVGTGV
jgi:hypothetical protein